MSYFPDLAIVDYLKVGVLVFLSFGGCVQKPIPFIEINSIPPPFDVNGIRPYAVWVNGQRVNMPKKDIMTLVKKIGKENIKPANTDDIHRGWLFSHFSEPPTNEPLGRKR
tara:strand:+ start:183 stop:512 length:330 start_codon:yes stop_codon:yes gene_type:complete